MKYELHAGRLIMKNDKRFCNLVGCIEPATGERLYDPVELDRFASRIVDLANPVDYDTGVQAIITKWIAPTSRRGSRVKATAAAGSITVHWDDGITRDRNHLLVARQLADKFGWEGQLIGGGLPDGSGHAYVMVYHRE